MRKSKFPGIVCWPARGRAFSHTDGCQASFSQKTTINVTSASLLPTLRGGRSPPWPQPTGRGCELLATLMQCSGIQCASEWLSIRANHNLLIIYKDLINTFHFPKENLCMMKTKNNSPSISRNRHRLSSPPCPREDQLDGLKHKFPMLRQTQIQASKLLSVRNRSSPVWF